MLKIIPPRAWGFDGPQVEIVKVASTGFRGVDLADFIKRASHPLADWVRHNRPAPGEVWTHSIALGSTETAGPNRNSDGYPNVMLERDHPTFEKYARFFRNHANRRPEVSYGVIKKAHYDQDLGRVEIITALNGTKEAARRNGGLVADRELEKLASNHDIAVSQSVKVPYDYCVSCGHQAKTRAEYCTPEMCKYGGCRDHLGRVFDDGTHLFVQNPQGVFFDLSNVSDTRGADRTAFITGKVAAGCVTGGAELAEQLGMVVPDYLVDPRTLTAMSCLRKLAAIRSIDPVLTWDEAVTERRKAASYTPDPVFPSHDAGAHAVLAELAGDGVILPPAAWLSAVTGTPVEKCAAAFPATLDPQRLLDRPDVHDLLASTSFGDNRLSTGRFDWLAPTVKSFSKEAALGVLFSRQGTPKTASTPTTPPHVRDEAEARYLAYQAGCLALHENSAKLGLLLSECAVHNRRP